LKVNLAQAQASQAKFYDRKHTPAPEFPVGSLVWLNRKNINTERPCNKLDYKNLGPFRVLAKVGSSAYKLDLPPGSRIHPVFHVSLLKPCRDDPFPSRTKPPPPPVVLGNELEYEVEEILDSRLHYGQLQYLVSWKGYGPTDNKWEPAANLSHAPALVKAFHRRYPNKPHSARSRR